VNPIDLIDRRCKITKEAAAPPAFQQTKQGVLVLFQDPVSYPEAWALQQQLHAEHLSGSRPDILLLLEHLPVYTMGRRTDPAHLCGGEAALRRTGATIQAVNRGGSVTYHGPGQLVGYPILELSAHAAGPKEYVRLLEEVLIRTLARWEIQGYRVDKNPGVWVRSDCGEAKIASIGVRIEHGVTLHGFALNVDLDLVPFSHIVPCGLAASRTTCLAELCRSSVPLGMVAEQVAEIFSTLFGIVWTRLPADIMSPALIHRPLINSSRKEA
jgi:lipoyl(octanoyl) transferase